jgi:hypothetical protein
VLIKLSVIRLNVIIHSVIVIRPTNLLSAIMLCGETLSVIRLSGIIHSVIVISLSLTLLSVIMLSVETLSVIRLSVMLSVVTLNQR